MFHTEAAGSSQATADRENLRWSVVSFLVKVAADLNSNNELMVTGLL